MNTSDRDDVHRVTVRAPMKKQLLAALRRVPTPRPRPRPVRNADGSYTVVLFLPASAMAMLAAAGDVQIVDSSNIGARLRQGPLSAIEAGLEPIAGYSAAPMALLGKAAPLPAL